VQKKNGYNNVNVRMFPSSTEYNILGCKTSEKTYDKNNNNRMYIIQMKFKIIHG